MDFYIPELKENENHLLFHAIMIKANIVAVTGKKKFSEYTQEDKYFIVGYAMLLTHWLFAMLEVGRRKELHDVATNFMLMCAFPEDEEEICKMVLKCCRDFKINSRIEVGIKAARDDLQLMTEDAENYTYDKPEEKILNNLRAYFG